MVFKPTTAKIPMLVGPFVPQPAPPTPEPKTLDGALTACVLIYNPPYRP